MNEHFVELGSYFSCDSGRSTYPIFDALTERRRVTFSHYHSCQPNGHSCDLCDLFNSCGLNLAADTHGFCLFVSLFLFFPFSLHFYFAFQLLIMIHVRSFLLFAFSARALWRGKTGYQEPVFYWDEMVQGVWAPVVHFLSFFCGYLYCQCSVDLVPSGDDRAGLLK